jgi:hypothetical protein
MIAAEGFYAHLESRERVKDAWIFESGVPVKVGDNTGKGWEERKLFAYTYMSRPLHGQKRPSLSSGAECVTGMNGGFHISGNFEALLSLAGNSFDLADLETMIGAEYSYKPGTELSQDSMPLRLRRIAKT